MDEFYPDQRVIVTATFYDSDGTAREVKREARVTAFEAGDGSGYDALTLIMPEADDLAAQVNERLDQVGDAIKRMA